ncbi:unnamed protein product [Lampetra planeri]
MTELFIAYAMPSPAEAGDGLCEAPAWGDSSMEGDCPPRPERRESGNASSDAVSTKAGILAQACNSLPTSLAGRRALRYKAL